MVENKESMQKKDAEEAKKVLKGRAFKGFPVQLDASEVRTHMTGFLVDDGRLSIHIYDSSGEFARPLGVVRIFHSDWDNLKRVGDTLLQRFPRYLMSVDGKQSFFTIRDAGVMLDSGWAKVEIGGMVLEQDFSLRPITDKERDKISEIADEHSSSQ